MRSAFRTTLRRLVRDRRGNTAAVFALACVPLITLVGCAIDYSRATQIRSRLQAAADAASVGSLAKASPAFAPAGSMISGGSIAVSPTRGSRGEVE